MPKLTKRLVDAAEAGTAETFLWDSEVKGFGVRVKPAGSKSFVLKYRIGTQTKRHTIGKVGSPYTVEEARKIAADLLRDICHGAHPAAAKAQVAALVGACERNGYLADDGERAVHGTIASGLSAGKAAIPDIDAVLAEAAQDPNVVFRRRCRAWPSCCRRSASTSRSARWCASCFAPVTAADSNHRPTPGNRQPKVAQGRFVYFGGTPYLPCFLEPRRMAEPRVPDGTRPAPEGA